MTDKEELPTIGQAISNWLGVQLPAIPMPQALKNFDKAVGKILLATGENLETWIKGNTAKAKTQGKFNVEGMYRTEEEKRKLENRAGATRVALEDLTADPPKTDAQAEIEDDWLNVFVRVAEDKSSDELQVLFGKILAGEVKRPGSFSLRTLQTLATISKSDAEKLSKVLSFAIAASIIPFSPSDDLTMTDRLFLEEISVAGHPSEIGGVALQFSLNPVEINLIKASQRGIVIQNKTPEILNFSLPGQPLTNIGIELTGIANSPPTDFEFLKKVAQTIKAKLAEKYAAKIADRTITIHVVSLTLENDNSFRYNVLHTLEP